MFPLIRSNKKIENKLTNIWNIKTYRTFIDSNLTIIA